MHFSRLLFLIPLLLLSAVCNQLSAQQILKGKIYEAVTDSVIAGVNIFNIATKVSTRSAADGSYSIAAAEGDTLIFSASGFMPDTLHVEFHLLLTQYDATLHQRVISLQAVKVISSYQTDSLNRRNYYRDIYNGRTGIRSPNRPDDGIGIMLSPISFLSKESKQERTLRKRLENEEKEFFIDHSFPLAWVKSLTGLSGDSLSLFMYQYRPSYSFCRTTDRQSMLVYVNDKLKEFRKPKKEH